MDADRAYLQRVLDNAEQPYFASVAPAVREFVGRSWTRRNFQLKMQGERYAAYVRWCRDRGLDPEDTDNQADYQGW